MAVNWALGLPRTDPFQAFQQGMEIGRVRQRENFLMQAQRQQVERQEQDRASQVRVGKHVAEGDLSGARTQAAQSGNLDLMQTVNQLSTAQQAELARVAAVLAPVYARLRQMPYEQRRPELQRIAPQLQARQVPADAIATYDPTDQNLDTDIALGQRVSNPTSLQQNYEWLQQQNPQLADQYLRRNVEPTPRYVTRPDGSVVMIAPDAPAVGSDDDEWDYSPPGQGGAGPAATPRNFPR
jgi:hypothetical protein